MEERTRGKFNKDLKAIIEEVGYDEEELDYMWNKLRGENNKVKMLADQGTNWRHLSSGAINDIPKQYHKNHKDSELLL